MLTIATFGTTLALIVITLLWFVLGALCFFLWRRAKSSGHLLMLIGAGLLGLNSLFVIFESFFLYGAWGQTFGIILLVGGFWVSVKPLVAADVAMVFGKLGVKPPPAPPAPPPAAPPPRAP